MASLLDNSEDAQFCDFMLQKTSRSFAAVIQQLPAEARPGVCVFYLVLRALDSVSDAHHDVICRECMASVIER